MSRIGTLKDLLTLIADGLHQMINKVAYTWRGALSAKRSLSSTSRTVSRSAWLKARGGVGRGEARRSGWRARYRLLRATPNASQARATPIC
jgi:hypothetical protein